MLGKSLASPTFRSVADQPHPKGSATAPTRADLQLATPGPAPCTAAAPPGVMGDKDTPERPQRTSGEGCVPTWAGCFPAVLWWHRASGPEDRFATAKLLSPAESISSDSISKTFRFSETLEQYMIFSHLQSPDSRVHQYPFNQALYPASPYKQPRFQRLN